MLHFCKTNFANIHHIALYLAVSLTHIPGSYGAPNTDQNESNEIEENERKKISFSTFGLCLLDVRTKKTFIC